MGRRVVLLELRRLDGQRKLLGQLQLHRSRIVKALDMVVIHVGGFLHPPSAVDTRGGQICFCGFLVGYVI